jgi:hypothetical protein
MSTCGLAGHDGASVRYVAAAVFVASAPAGPPYGVHRLKVTMPNRSCM